MENLNLKELYKLQDKVLDAIFSHETEFYLTGGTCLNRFHYQGRHSEDLDFFTNFSHTFHYSVREIEAELTQNNYKISKEVDTKDFVRLSVNDFLQLDFVNDRIKKFGKIESKNKIKLDNFKNILSNKITAVLSRDSSKDIFDILLICQKERFDWKEIIKQAKGKMVFEKDDLIFRLDNFPPALFANLYISDNRIVENFNKKMEIITADIFNESKNNLAMVDNQNMN
ncbi:MAG: nucleotidyl transferase AbiEii/AbiGii toxin family protein [Candidatus Cloacimonadota bacterium]|nr:nucleotidyl transferase AbiEii/AbiGii toxin family protein [Candidatus Cloacimonadota bacterium]